MAYRVAPGIPLVLIRDQEGLVHYHYECGADDGPHIPWIDDEHAAWLLELNMIERVDNPTTEPPSVSAELDEPRPEAQAPETDTGPADLSVDTSAPTRDNADDLPNDPGRNWLDDITDTQRIDACIGALDQLGLPQDTGAFKARKLLRAADYHFPNSTIAEAIKARKQLTGQQS